MLKNCLATFKPIGCCALSLNAVMQHMYPNFTQLLRDIPPTQVSTLANGLLVATEEREVPHACIGLYVDAGSRFEICPENGVSHFFQHIAFKSTTNRSKSDLINQMSCTGARFYTHSSREINSFAVECLSQDIPIVVDLLANCVFNNAFAPEEIEIQKKVVEAEMQKYDADSNELIIDYLHSSAFMGTPLSQTVMGPSCNLKNFTEETLKRYVRKYYDPARMVLAAVGGFTHEQITGVAEACFPQTKPCRCLEPYEYRYTGAEIRYRDDSMPLVNVAIAFEAPNFCDTDSLILDVIAEYLSSWDRSMLGGNQNANYLARAASIDNLAEAYKPINIKYRDAGLFGVQFVCRMIHTDDFVYTMQSELMRLCTMITLEDIERAKNQLKTNILTRTQEVRGACDEIGRWVLLNGCRPPISEMVRQVDNISPDDVKSLSMKLFYDKCPVVAAVGPVECLPEYCRIRAGQYWLRV